MSARTDMVRRTRSVPTGHSRPVKIVVTGPFAAGKTTLIRTISEIAIVGTEREVTDATRDVKERTTVAMDFGRITFDEDSLFLFGTPGQRRFEVMWDILSEGMIGFILLVHAGDPRSVEEASPMLASFRESADVPFVVGVTHLDEVAEPEPVVFEKVRTGLGLDPATPLMACDPRNREDIKDLMLRILFEVKARLETAEANN